MRVAIIGFGVVGRSVLSFLTSELGKNFARATDLIFWNGRPFTKDDEQIIINAGAQAVTSDCMTLGEIMAVCDQVIVSPGVNLNRYKQYEHKIICELDIFSRFFDNLTIGITGSLGKTTTTKLLGLLAGKILLRDSFKRVAIGGNIGLGMLDLVAQRASTDLAVLELSSFQLEFSKTWAPDIAIWTNCFANHLDRHETMSSYVLAKLNILRHQSKSQVALLSASLLDGEVGQILASQLSNIKSQVYLVGSLELDRVPLQKFSLITVQDGHVMVSQVLDGHVTAKKSLCSVADLPKVTFLDNWLHVLGALYALGGDISELITWLSSNQEIFTLDNEHRCEFVKTVRGVDFYNDSKATVIQSTEAAVRRLAANGRPIILILGGLGKGVDRSPLLERIPLPAIKKIYCFGKECSVFSPMADCYQTLEQVMAEISKIMAPGDQVLLSPSGTSYDLYKNYEERGRAFKNLVDA
jgi:UDP-N-acetylmuramoylalanine--D-glutamate ligase